MEVKTIFRIAEFVSKCWGLNEARKEKINI